MRTIAVTESEPSFTLPSTPVCEWQSMMPGVTYLPVASMTRAFGSRAFTFGPTSAILPSRIRIEPLLIVPCEAVIMVAFLIRVSDGAVAVTTELAPAAIFVLPLFCANAEATIASVSSDDRIALVFFIIPPFNCRLPIADCRFVGFFQSTIGNRKSTIGNRQSPMFSPRPGARELERAHRAHHDSAAHGIAFDGAANYRVNGLAAHVDGCRQPNLIPCDSSGLDRYVPHMRPQRAAYLLSVFRQSQLSADVPLRRLNDQRPRT